MDSIKSILKECSPFLATSEFGKLLLDPRMQSNTLRLEELVHASVVYGKGTKRITQKNIVHCFNRMGELCGPMEDPAEDVFVSLVITNKGMTCPNENGQRKSQQPCAADSAVGFLRHEEQSSF